MDRTVEQRKRQAEASARFRAKQKALGVKRVLSEGERAKQREYLAKRRARAAVSGEVLACDQWWKKNRERHRDLTREWVARNPVRASVLSRKSQAKRRSTPWGKINNRIVAIINRSLKAELTGKRSKYCAATGYLWTDLRAHIERQFTPSMCWENWGDVWELDHIKPLSSFKYESLKDPLFRECWALSNLRPLLREENAAKGAKAA